MKRYTMSFASSTSHVPAHPERTAVRSIGDDVEYQVWPSEAAMQTSLRMQGSRASSRRDWTPWESTNTAKRLTRRDPKRSEKRRMHDAVLKATAALLQGKRLEIDRPGRPIIYMGSTTENRRDPFWYEGPHGRTYKETPEEVIRAVLPHVGTEAVLKAKVHARDPLRSARRRS